MEGGELAGDLGSRVVRTAGGGWQENEVRAVMRRVPTVGPLYPMHPFDALNRHPQESGDEFRVATGGQVADPQPFEEHAGGREGGIGETIPLALELCKDGPQALEGLGGVVVRHAAESGAGRPADGAGTPPPAPAARCRAGRGSGGRQPAAILSPARLRREGGLWPIAPITHADRKATGVVALPYPPCPYFVRP